MSIFGRPVVLGFDSSMQSPNPNQALLILETEAIFYVIDSLYTVASQHDSPQGHITRLLAILSNLSYFLVMKGIC